MKSISHMLSLCILASGFMATVPSQSVSAQQHSSGTISVCNRQNNETLYFEMYAGSHAYGDLYSNVSIGPGLCSNAEFPTGLYTFAAYYNSTGLSSVRNFYIEQGHVYVNISHSGSDIQGPGIR